MGDEEKELDLDEIEKRFVAVYDPEEQMTFRAGENEVHSAQRKAASLRWQAICEIKNEPKKQMFLLELSQRGIYGLADKAAGISSETRRRWIADDKDFARACYDAEELAADLVEHEVLRRATEGVPEPVFHQGVEVGTVQKYSDSLAKFVLSARRPRFRDRVDVTHKGTLAPQQERMQIYLPSNGREVIKGRVVSENVQIGEGENADD